ncbi:MAG TPA: hypothetical protein ENK19_07880 [Acidobacteria bacterium]|nr:hypothetical protein [Acidobacteriota bacterium]
MKEDIGTREQGGDAWFTGLAGAGWVAFVLLWLTASFLSRARLVPLTVEDGPVENATALLFLVASVIMAETWWRSARPGRRPRRLHGLLVLAVLLFICFGEEISWGQRIFGWRTPPAIASLNLQGETNLHNLELFHPRNPDGTPKGFLPLLLNMNRLFALFWLAYCVVLPLLARRSETTRSLAARLGVPIPPLWIGGLFLLSFLVPHLLERVRGADLAGPLDEIKEMADAAAYFLLAVVFLLRGRRHRPE